MTRVLVTGAGGFVGQHLVRALVKHGDEVYASVYSSSPELQELLPTDHITTGDLTDYTYTKDCLLAAQPEIIYHLAALSIVHTDVDSSRDALTNNLALQYNLLEGIRECAPTARLVAICSGNVYGLVSENELPISESTPVRPLNAYAVSKLSQETLALQYYYAHKLDIVILRPFNHTGEGQTDNFVIPALARQFAHIKQGKQEPVIKLGNTETARDFTDVKDMVAAYILAASSCKSGETYNIGSGKASKISEILDLMQEISGTKIKIEVDPSRVRGVDVPVLLADSSKFRSLTGWEPTISFRQTLTKVLQYWEGK